MVVTPGDLSYSADAEDPGKKQGLDLPKRAVRISKAYESISTY